MLLSLSSESSRSKNHMNGSGGLLNGGLLNGGLLNGAPKNTTNKDVLSFSSQYVVVIVVRKFAIEESMNGSGVLLNGGLLNGAPKNKHNYIRVENYGSTAAATNNKKEDDEENPPLKKQNNNNDKKTKEKYGISDAYKWLYGALSRQPFSQGLGASTLALFAIAGEGFLVTQPAVFLGEIVDTIGQNVGNEGDAWPLFTLIAASLVGKEICTISRKYIVERQATALQKGAFLDQAKHLLSVRVDALQDRRVGDLAVRLDKSVEGLIKLTKVTFMEGIPNMTTAAFALYLAYNSHWAVGAAMAGAVTVGAAVTVLQVNSQKGIRISLNEQKAGLGGSIAEMLGNLPYIRASGMRLAEEKRLDDGAELLRETEFRHHKYMMTFHGAKDLIGGIGFTVVVGVAINLAIQGEISSGDILTLAMLYSKAAQPIEKMHKVIDEMHESVIKIGALSAVRDLALDPGLSGTLLPQTGNNVRPLHAEGLDVTLGKDRDNRVLNELSLEIQRGSIVGLAGTSGSGKSTLLKAALGLIPNYEGSIRLFGVETKDLEKQALSHRIAYAQQEPFVLTGSLRENLLLAQPHGLDLQLDDASLFRALERACLGPSDFDWGSQGLDTHIHEAGRNLSGGQRQRLALARVFLQQKAELIVLDEATSALDNATEARVIAELHAHAADRTVLMVAHRLTTLRGANRVLVMDEGRVVQDGTYDELSQTPGVFRRLLEYNNE
eukprot:CAMPEP_0194159902 /NCGR_PEP_ID=MMETSP0152-20130528/78093_1 /TAXON_ID=1049557 /ORGANISM="Thalassiothrix antarctica, Strain L6-D1" /LENGTH=720 /DNA_ID=CAMNT_0038869531 /DNA_START=337 /DNA_END=2500 /DNA_ORIENTATION=-